MPFKFFIVPIHGLAAAEEVLNTFLRSHRVLAVDRRWVEEGSDSFWAFCIDYLDGAGGSPANDSGSGRRKVDYKEVLAPDEFAVFSKLRELRKEIAQVEAVPVYTLFTNEQLAQIVQAKVRSKADLEKVAGVGDARIEKYGDRILSVLESIGASAHETDRQPVAAHP